MTVFGAFIMEADVASKQMGFGLAMAILLDAFVIRMMVLPSLLAMMGKAAWWLPKWLDRIVPNVDVEGEKLRAMLPATTEPAEPVAARD
jgi:RND superfamily putative drug exporter